MVAIASVIASAFGRIVLPAVTGRVAGSTVERIEWLTSMLSYASAIGLAIIVALAAWELSLAGRSAKNLTFQRAVVVGLSGGVSAIAFLAFPQPLFPILCFGLAIACIATMLISASCAFSLELTKSLAIALIVGGLGVVHRLIAWRMNARSDHPGEGLAMTAMWVHSASLLCECGLQLVVTTWVASRSPWRGRFLAHLGTGLSLVLAYVLVRTHIDETESGIIGMLRATLGSDMLPKSFALAPLDVFLAPASLWLAVVAASQPRAYAPVPAALALLVASRLRADVPLSALMLSAAALLALMAVRQRLLAAHEIAHGVAS